MREVGIDGDYIAIRVSRGNAVTTIRHLQHDGYAGCNVTTPLKEEALAACEVLDEDARMAQAVNTIYFGRKVFGANTDGIGARTALETALGESVMLHRIGILGTGATARAILAQLHETDAYTFCWGRDPEKVIAICERFECQIWPPNPPEIVISCLLPEAELPEALRQDVRKAELIMDVNYGERSTLGRQLGREIVRGDTMLEAQARASFDFWLAHVEQVI
jgi:shikimate 5-dehydrogenase